VQAQAQEVVIQGCGEEFADLAAIDCGNSGTTMRLLMGILAGRPGEYTLDGDESLRGRPMERVAEPLRLMGATIKCSSGKCPVKISGGSLRGIDYDLPVASAQLKSAVLLAGLQAEGRTTLKEPALSRDHTERLLELMGGQVSRSGRLWRVERSRLSLPASHLVPGDISSAAFFLCAAAIIPGSQVRAEGVLLNPTRTGFLKVLRRMGAKVELEVQDKRPEPVGRVRVAYSPHLTGCQITPAEIPLLVDEVPILSLVATQAQGVTVFQGVGELRLKESDRLAALASQLGLLGAKVTAEADRLVVEGPTPLKGAPRLDSFADHRLAMTLRLASLMAGTETEIEGEASTAVSYPGFHDDLKRLSA
ncbi:MAG: 3-phosphoshikimate 1-carboxyvinyltransferase, partial [Deltaproteobacteria bacterium]|nr:3-phosphoshikimate 1-carboxyvinyltransferase [Deltaproteobacteria bacterium]